MKYKHLFFLGLVTAAMIVSGCAEDKKPSPAQMGPDIKPHAAIAKGTKPSPQANGGKKTTAGRGKTAVNTANPTDDGDSFWIESLDIDGDGTIEETELIHDDEDKVVYLYAVATFKCQGGGTGEGDLLIAVNAEGNPRGRPAGSGWFAVSLDKGECGAKAAVVYGCAFDANGNSTSCGVATIDEKNDQIVIVVAQ